jgi:DNA modification methylase
MMRKHLEKTVDEDFIERVTKDLAHPITVRPLKGSEYEILWGNRRWYAFLVKKLRIPCRVLNLDDREALWTAYGENTDRLDVDADEEVEHILRLIDAELQGTPEYEACNNDPKKAVTVAFQVKMGRTTKRIVSNVANNLAQKVQDIFSRLPRSRKLTIETFYTHKLPMLRISEGDRVRVKEKEIRSSAGALEVIASVKDEFARQVVLDWTRKQKKVPVRVLERRARTLNRNAALLEQVKNKVKKEKKIRLALEKGISPKKFELELKNLLPKTREVASTAFIEDNGGVQLYCPADSADMSQIQDESVRLIVTSPPYGRKIAFEGDYLSKAKTPDEYFSLIEPIIEECFRVLVPSGKLVINWADPIGEWGNEEPASSGEYAEHIYAHRWVELAERVGFKLWARQIWRKNVYYSIAQNRVRWEDACRTDGKTHLDWEWILTFRKPGPMPEGNTGLPYEKWVELSKAVWYISGAQDERGLATFPKELVSRLIQLYSFEGDLILDPFLGTGTTLAVAKVLGRRAVGYEINPDLKPTIKERLSTATAKVAANNAAGTVAPARRD